MTSEPPVPASTNTKNPLKAFFSDPRLVPMVNYILFFIFLMSLGFSGVLAITLIYLCQDEAPEWLKSHYSFQKRTFWIGIPLILILIVVTGLKIPFLAYIAFGSVFLWTTGRSIIGVNHLIHHRPYPKPKTWFI